jgi:hypothetical protein
MAEDSKKENVESDTPVQDNGSIEKSNNAPTAIKSAGPSINTSAIKSNDGNGEQEIPGTTYPPQEKNKWKRINQKIHWISLPIFWLGVIILPLLFFLVHRPPLMIIDAKTRSLVFDVVNSQESRVRFQSQASLKVTPRSDPECLSGLFAPALKSRVSYTIFANTLVIRTGNNTTEAAGLFFPDTANRQEPIILSSSSSIAYGPDTKCETKSIAPLRLPIWGPAQLGKVPQPQTLSGQSDPFGGILIHGKVYVFGQNTFGNGIYMAKEIVLPAGARLSSEGIGGAKTAPWWGYATYFELSSNGEKPNGLVVSASTIANRLILRRLAAGPQVEKIEVGFLTKITGDPFFAKIGALFIGLFMWSEFIIAIRHLTARKGHERY